MESLRWPTMPSVGEGVEQLELSYTIVRNVKWSSHIEKQFVS